MNSRHRKKVDATPYVIGTVVVAMLGGLGLWQVARGLDKRAGLDAYTSEGSYQNYFPGMALAPFQRLRVSGQYDEMRQIIIDNMIVNGRNGHFVITPFEPVEGEALLLVNRGWIERTQPAASADAVAFDASRLTLRGRVGRLPKAGMRMGDPFAASGSWPKHAVYPYTDDIAAELDAEVLPFVLLLDADEPHGFVRDWEPETMSASRHFGYAFQWFAMAAVLSGLLVLRYWRVRKST